MTVKISEHNATIKSKLKNLPEELLSVIEKIYIPAGMKITDIMHEAESLEYSACRFLLNGHKVIYRIAKTTPRKIGQFVTMWKRATANDEIAPLHINDGIDFVVVHVSQEAYKGQFVFGKQILKEKSIMSTNIKEGKRAIRVYAPWTKPVAKEAIKTQQWQAQYFFPIAENGSDDLKKVRKLFNILSIKN